MKNSWQDETVEEYRESFGNDPADTALSERVYTSRLLGREPDLVLHGGGNTSVKVERIWPDGEIRNTLHIKGSGWDLATIEAPGLPALNLEALLALRQVKDMSDPEMVSALRTNLLDPESPNPSVETLLHAFIPHRFVDHTHSLPILILANQPDAEFHCQRLFGNEVAFVPYVMPGYDLSVAAASIQEENPNCKGLFLQNHGLFTFADTAQESYRFTIEYTNRADQYITDKGALLANHLVPDAGAENSDLTERITHALKTLFPDAVDLSLDYREEDNVRKYTSHFALDDLSRRGTVTPDHVIRTKPFPMICDEDESENQLVKKIEIFIRDYQAYFDRHAPYASEPKTMLSPIPKVVVVKNKGIYGIDKSQKAAAIVADLAVQTARAVITSEQLCRFQPISEKDLFSMEYWSLEQAKLTG